MFTFLKCNNVEGNLFHLSKFFMSKLTKTSQLDSEAASPQLKKDKLARKLQHWSCGPHTDLCILHRVKLLHSAKVPQEECLKVELQCTILRNTQIYLESNIHPQKLFGSLELRMPNHFGEPGLGALESSVQNLKFQKWNFTSPKVNKWRRRSHRQTREILDFNYILGQTTV